MSDESDKLDAGERVARVIGRARRGEDVDGAGRIERLTQDWPELQQALSKLMFAHGVSRPDSWKPPPPPAGHSSIIV